MVVQSRRLCIYERNQHYSGGERERQRKMNKFQNLLKMVKFANHLAILAFFLSFISTNQPFPLEMSARFFFVVVNIVHRLLPCFVSKCFSFSSTIFLPISPGSCVFVFSSLVCLLCVHLSLLIFQLYGTRNSKESYR